MKNISPKFMIDLEKNICDQICKQFKTHSEMKRYIRKWWKIISKETSDTFCIERRNDGKIDIAETLHNISDISEDFTIQIAVDLGIETPGIICSIPKIEGLDPKAYSNVTNTFAKATHEIYEDPPHAVELATSALETVCKHVLEQGHFLNINYDSKATLRPLVTNVLKSFSFYPLNTTQIEIKTIGSSLIKAVEALCTLRNSKTNAHGKDNSQTIIDDKSSALFVVNATVTIGGFILTYYKKLLDDHENDPEVFFR